MNPFIPRSLQREIVLASASPRRISILEGLDVPFRSRPAHLDVDGQELPGRPYDLPVELARLKAAEVARLHPEALVIGADTVVIADGDVLGKPRGREEAREHLRKLSGRSHDVVTGVSLKIERNNIEVVDSAVTSVRFKKLSDHDIEAYVDSGEWRGKAGAYAIQGLAACFVESIEGCYFNVVGLPVALLFDLINDIARKGNGC
jgi:septum formation protein